VSWCVLGGFFWGFLRVCVVLGVLGGFCHFVVVSRCWWFFGLLMFCCYNTGFWCLCCMVGFCYGLWYFVFFLGFVWFWSVLGFFGVCFGVILCLSGFVYGVGLQVLLVLCELWVVWVWVLGLATLGVLWFRVFEVNIILLPDDLRVYNRFWWVCGRCFVCICGVFVFWDFGFCVNSGFCWFSGFF